MTSVSISKWERTVDYQSHLKCIFHILASPADAQQCPILLWCSTPSCTAMAASKSGRFFSSLTNRLFLFQVLQNLGKDQYPQQSLEQIGTRIAKVLEKVSTPRWLEIVACPLTSFWTIGPHMALTLLPVANVTRGPG